MLVRLSKRMSELGLCSRREADKLIEQGLVIVNGQAVTQLGFKVKPEDKISISQEGQSQLQQKITLMLHKPVGYVSSQPEKDYKSAMSLLQKSNRVLNTKNEKISLNLKNLAPAGRLDIDSLGLIIYTQDGVMAKKIIGENSSVDKEYIVKFTGTINEQKMKLLRHGLKLDEKKLKPAKVKQLDEQTINITLKEGRKRQIRRMLKEVQLEVTHLKRIRIGSLLLGDLQSQKWRLLTIKEQKDLLKYQS